MTVTNSRYGLLVISPDFIKKRWTEFELKCLLSKEINGEKVIIPIWHNITLEELLKFSPYLADKLAINSKESKISEIIFKIIQIIKPELSTKILRRKTWNEIVRSANIEISKGENISADTPVIHTKLPKQLIHRIRLFRIALFQVYPLSMKDWINGFLHDHHPSKEIVIWERIATIYLEYCNEFKIEDIDKRKEIFSIIFQISFGFNAEYIVSQNPNFEFNKVSIIFKMYHRKKPYFDIKNKLMFSETYNENEPFDKEDYSDIDLDVLS